MKKSYLRSFSFLLLLWGIVACGSGTEPGNGSGGTDENPPVELKFTSFKMSVSRNAGTLSKEVTFPVGTAKMKGRIADLTDLRALVVDFKATGKVFVGDKEQQSGVTPNDFTDPVVYRIEDDKGNSKEFTVSVDHFTGLPIVYFDTDSGQGVADKENWEGATIRIVGTDGLEGLEETSVLTKGRGNSTWNFKAKQPYALKFDSKTSLLGMPKHKRWILMANYRDRTMLRNAVAFEIANRTGLAWTPRIQMVELVMNGKHRGNYMVCEQIRIDKNRININEMSPSDTEGEAITGGYVLEVDQWNDEVNMFKSLFMENEWGETQCTVMQKFPDAEDTNPQQVEYIKNYFWAAEREMMAGNFQKVYDEYIDMDSFIDFWFVQELTGNQEPNRGPFSCFMYKDINGKLFAGPVWDFDFTTFMQGFSTRFYNERAAWYKLLLTDPIFRQRMKERWNELKPKFATVPEYIDRMEAMLTQSANYNWAMYDPGHDGDLYGLFNGDELLPYATAVKRMRDFYTEKFEWMDGQFQSW